MTTSSHDDPDASASAELPQRRRWRLGVAVGGLLAGLAAAAAVAGFVLDLFPRDSWRERADAACIEQLDRLQHLFQRSSADGVWRAHVRLYQDLRDVDDDIPASRELEWRPLINAARDMAEIWGMAANVIGSDAGSVLDYYSPGLASDRRWMRDASRNLGLRSCGSKELLTLERLSMRSEIGR